MLNENMNGEFIPLHISHKKNKKGCYLWWDESVVIDSKKMKYNYRIKNAFRTCRINMLKVVVMMNLMIMLCNASIIMFIVIFRTSCLSVLITSNTIPHRNVFVRMVSTSSLSKCTTVRGTCWYHLLSSLFPGRRLATTSPISTGFKTLLCAKDKNDFTDN